MRCSSFEPLLDDYVDGTLEPKRHALVAEHAATCENCAALLAELRVIDALLLQPRRVEPAPNFTFAVMAEARTLHAPHRSHTPAPAVLATYLGFAWSVIALFFVFGGNLVHATLATVVATGRHAGTALQGTSTAVSQLLGVDTFSVTATLTAILALDFAVAGVAIVMFTFVRPRLAALLARSGPAR
jgi:anti-sigma factor RsiW